MAGSADIVDAGSMRQDTPPSRHGNAVQRFIATLYGYCFPPEHPLHTNQDGQGNISTDVQNRVDNTRSNPNRGQLGVARGERTTQRDPLANVTDGQAYLPRSTTGTLTPRNHGNEREPIRIQDEHDERMFMFFIMRIKEGGG